MNHRDLDFMTMGLMVTITILVSFLKKKRMPYIPREKKRANGFTKIRAMLFSSEKKKTFWKDPKNVRQTKM